jgi:opacity protein-like surface antigen
MFAIAGILPLTVPVSGLAADWYVGLAGGASSADASRLGSDYEQVGAGFVPRQITSSYSDQSHGAWKALAGWRALPYLGLELSYADYGSQTFGYTGVQFNPGNPPPFIRVEQSRSARRTLTAWGGDILGIWPIAPEFEILAGIGAVSAKVELSIEGTNRDSLFLIPVSSSDTSTNTVARYSIGANWMPTPEWIVRVNYEYLDKVGKSYQRGSDAGTGIAAQQTLWLSLIRQF